MRLLLTLDEGNYSPAMPVVEKTTVRALICRDGKYIMQRAGAGWYKIPGGGVEGDETHLQTLLREVEEEVGLRLIPGSLRALGEILEKREDRKCPGQIFLRHSLYYSCDAEAEERPTHMTASEIALGFRPAWATLEEIIAANEALGYHDRDTDLLRLLRGGALST
ncbi:MAG: NUDIX domain-containing protein [Oscillospiraceae bacterium]|nr:NUDIX domain-containing protein [Oscillospiraceae bacterium]